MAKANISLILLIIIILVYLIAYTISIYFIIKNRNEYIQNSKYQSAYCLSFTCPCDNPSQPPCFGYSKMRTPEGNWICSSSPNIEVNDNGVQI